MKKIAFVLVSFLSVLLWACSKNNSGSGGTASMKVYLTDDPAFFDRVYLDIKSVQVKASSDGSEDGWQTLNIGRAGIYNLLDFKNGIDTLLGSITLPAGTISQLRLVLGSNNSLVINGISYPLTTPSAQQSGLKLAINATLLAGIDYKIWIDFDAARSIVQTGAGSYILKPVIRTFTEASSGAIKGFALPVAAKGWVFAIQNATDTISSTPADAVTGAFLLRGLPAASYKLSFHATAGTYRDTTLNGIVVLNGAVTDAGSVTMR